MDLLFKSEPQISFNDTNMMENNVVESTDMAQLLRLLSVAEHIVKETDFEKDHDLIEEYVDLFESTNDTFAPSIFDLTSLPPLRQTHNIINPSSSSSAIPGSSSSVINNNHNISGNTDPFEPTPIGPCINVVRDMPLSCVFGARVAQNSDYFPWPDVVSKNSASLEPVPLATPSSKSNSSSSNNSRKFQDEQWKQRFQDLLDFQHKHGHLLVPHAYSKNTKLSQWVKR
jgi:hypothetical protein